MTPEQVEAEIRAHGCGWDQVTQGVVLEADETPLYCNAVYCRALAAAATAAEVTPAEAGQAVRELVDGDDTSIRAILAP